MKFPSPKEVLKKVDPKVKKKFKKMLKDQAAAQKSTRVLGQPPVKDPKDWKSYTVTASQFKLLGLLKSTGGNLTASSIGDQLWGRRGRGTAHNAYGRPAGKMLNALEKQGLVYYQYNGPSKRWFAYA